MKLCTFVAAILFVLPALVRAQDTTQIAVPVQDTQDTVQVKSVTSGITFTTTDGRTITLLGLAVPKSQAVSASDAKEHLAEMIQGKTVVLTLDTLAPADTKKTKLRYVSSGSTSVNLTMVEEGYATPSATKHSLADAFREAHAEAQGAQRGAHATERSSAVQCSGITKKGTQCKRMTTSLSGKCWQHE